MPMKWPTCTFFSALYLRCSLPFASLFIMVLIVSITTKKTATTQKLNGKKIAMQKLAHANEQSENDILLKCLSIKWFN